MVRTIRPGAALALLPLLAAPVLSARAAGPMAAVRAGDWAEAQAAASGLADPVGEKLITYYRMLDRGAASASEIAAFVAQNPDWPNQAALERRRQEAIAAEPDDTAALADCDARPISLPPTLARCAVASASAGHPNAAAEDARKAWVNGFTDPGVEQAAFLAHWKSVLRPEDERERFDRLAWIHSPAAQAQLERLAPADRPAAKARLALQHNAPDALALLDKLPQAERDAPGMVLDRARWLRRAKRDKDAVALWKMQGEAAERAAPAGHLAAFWTERNTLARQFLAEGDPADAYAMADDTTQTAAAPAASAAFLAGFVALRELHDPDTAIAQFRKLLSGKAAVSQARAHYWLGRALAAAGKDPGPDYAKAAAFPTTFYGQLAARALGDSPDALARRIRDLHDPAFSHAEAWDFASGELVRAAAMLVAWGEFGRARAFLLRAQEIAPDAAEQTLSARLALALGMPDAAVFVARRMGLHGLLLARSGWPEPVTPPPAPPDPAITLALVRQESSFDAGVVSPAGARGLMQLMPGTAETEAHRAGAEVTEVALTADPVRNMELGTSYFRSLLAGFGGSLPLAVAAYNAGPNRVRQWIAAYGDPRPGATGEAVDMLDWIELIPFEETRNYVERVLESVVVYQARRDEPADGLVAQWMR